MPEESARHTSVEITAAETNTRRRARAVAFPVDGHGSAELITSLHIIADEFRELFPFPASFALEQKRSTTVFRVLLCANQQQVARDGQTATEQLIRRILSACFQARG